MGRRILFFVLSFVLVSVLCLPVWAGEMFYLDGVDVVRGSDPAVAPEGMIPLGTDRGQWKTTSGQMLPHTDAESEDGMFTQPIHILTDRVALADLSVPAELDAHRTASMVCVAQTKDAAGGYAYLRLRMYAAEGVMTTQITIPVNTWCTVRFDIGAWAERDGVYHIEMELDAPGIGAGTEFHFSGLWLDEPMNAELRERFMTDAFNVRGGTIYLSAGVPYAYLIPTESSPILEAQVLPPTTQTETNALRIVLDNESACNSLTLHYAYNTDGANSRSVTLDMGTGRQTMLFPLEQADELRYIRLVFTGAARGLITVHSVNAVSVYDSGSGMWGEIDTCSFDSTNSRITVQGTVAHDIMIANKQSKLALFAISPWEDANTVLTDGRAPLAVADMSIRYSFNLPVKEGDYAALGARYMVVLQITDQHGQNARYGLLTGPKSVSMTYSASGVSTGDAVKGVQTALVSSAGQAGASLYLVDVYLDRLCDGSAMGYRYIRGENSYYFNYEVLSALDREIRLRSAAGETVYLRFLLSSDAAEVSYALSPTGLPVDTVRGIILSSAEARDTVAAVTEFLTERYAEITEYGTIAGIVVGEQVDDAASHNYTGTYALSDYVDHYADLLTLIANVGRVKNPGLKVIVPISDRRSAVCITPALLEDSYDSELFLRSLFMRLDALGGPDVSLMLESEHNPFSLSGNALGEANRLTESNAERSAYYNADNLGDFSDLLDNLTALYRSMPETFLYLWSPAEETGEALSAAYAYLYYRLRFSTHAEAFIISFARAEAQGDMRGMRELRYLMKYIDTDRSPDVTESSLAVFGVNSWSELITGFSEKKLPLHSYTEGELMPAAQIGTGSYAYWDFTSSHSTRGWYAGAHLSAASVKGGGDSRGLMGILDRSSAETEEYCELVYRFADSEPTEPLDRLTFDLMLEGDGVWEICIFLGGDGARMEQKCVLEAGRRAQLTLDPAPMDGVGIDYMKLCTKPVSGSGEGTLCLYGVRGESDTLDDEAISRALAELRSAGAAGDDGDGRGMNTPWIFAIAAVFIASAAFAIFLGRKQED